MASPRLRSRSDDLAVRVTRRLNASPETLFGVLTQELVAVRGVRRVQILGESIGGPASVGTVRRVDLAVGYVIEEFVATNPPHRFDYLIREATVPFEHRFGRIEFLDRGDHTEGVWSSTFGFAQRLIRPASPLIAAGTHAAFAWALRELDRAALALTSTQEI